ncbi:LacI family DNA-binding transcriptional regulator [Saccharicrinis sp. FJH54]|uniref:LacI family DNA-binding transcriptional regulator n=1 Tax=Saccharicrinis sp. FJH54 TaxID=3344665 RepID=UPI0035D42557
MARKTVSLKDLAQELNVSVSTVSRALKNHPDISQEVIDKVKALAKERNYRSANFAETTHLTSTKAIGVIVPNLERSFYSSIISGIENYAKRKGYFIIIANSRESYDKEKECVENLIGLNVEGLIMCLSQETQDNSHFDLARSKDIPVVFFDRVCRTNEFSSVVANNSEAAKDLTNHLYQTGSRRIAHIAGPKKLSITRDRVSGYLSGLQENDLKYNEEHLVYSDLTPVGAKKAIDKLMKSAETPDAIFCVNDTVAYVVMKELKERGYKIPQDIAVTGFNNELHSDFVEPTLTTVSHPTFEMGEETARLLIRQLQSEHKHSPRQIVMKTELVIRESSIKNM